MVPTLVRMEDSDQLHFQAEDSPHQTAHSRQRGGEQLRRPRPGIPGDASTNSASASGDASGTTFFPFVCGHSTNLLSNQCFMHYIASKDSFDSELRSTNIVLFEEEKTLSILVDIIGIERVSKAH